MNKKTLLSAILVASLSVGAVASYAAPALASNDNDANVSGESQTQKVDQDLVKVSQDAFISMKDIHNARLALFDGDPLDARTNIDAAVTRINAAVADAQNYALDINASKQAGNKANIEANNQADEQYVPFYSFLTVMDRFSEQQEKTATGAQNGPHAKAHQQAKKGRENIKLTDVNVAVTAKLIPVKFAQAHIQQASKLMNEGKFYEANLALKAVNDATIVHTLAVDGVPKNAASDHS